MNEDFDDPEDIDFEDESVEEDTHSSDSGQWISEDKFMEEVDEAHDYTVYIGKTGDTLWITNPFVLTSKIWANNIIKAFPGPKIKLGKRKYL